MARFRRRSSRGGRSARSRARRTMSRNSRKRRRLTSYRVSRGGIRL